MNRQRWSMLAAAVLAAVFAVVIVVFGLIPLPEYPALSASPDASIPGSIVIVRYGEQERPCLYIVAASGAEERRLVCQGDVAAWIDSPQWTRDGRIAVQSTGGDQLVLLDAATGEVAGYASRAGEPSPPKPGGLIAPVREPIRGWDPARREDGVWIRTLRAGEVEIVQPDGTSRTLLSQRAPRDYSFHMAQWSPDGEWVLLLDSRSRLVVVAPTGGPRPRMVAEEVSNASWYIPGETGNTIEVTPAEPAGS